MTPRRLSGATAAALLALLALPGGPALARGGGGGGGGKDPQDQRDERAEERKRIKKALESVGAALEAKSPSRVLAFVQADRKLTLQLDGRANDYEPEQAEKVLEKWFKGKTFSKFDLDKVDGRVGVFKIRYRTAGSDAEQERRLHVTVSAAVETRGGKRHHLTKIVET